MNNISLTPQETIDIINAISQAPAHHVISVINFLNKKLAEANPKPLQEVKKQGE